MIQSVLCVLEYHYEDVSLRVTSYCHHLYNLVQAQDFCQDISIQLCFPSKQVYLSFTLHSNENSFKANSSDIAEVNFDSDCFVG